MPDSLDTIEADRSKLLQKFLTLGDLRPGSVTAVVRRCGRSNCHCAKDDDPGHDPQFRLTRRVAGRGANAIIALRCCELSGNFEDYWEAGLDRSAVTAYEPPPPAPAASCLSLSR